MLQKNEQYSPLSPELTAKEVRSFIEENFLFRGNCESIRDDESLIAAGLIDSTGVLELVAFLEEQFGIEVADADIMPENLDSIRAITSYIASHKPR